QVVVACAETLLPNGADGRGGIFGGAAPCSPIHFSLRPPRSQVPDATNLPPHLSVHPPSRTAHQCQTLPSPCSTRLASAPPPMPNASVMLAQIRAEASRSIVRNRDGR